jgi:type IV pilus assembly protein PilM
VCGLLIFFDVYSKLCYHAPQMSGMEIYFSPIYVQFFMNCSISVTEGIMRWTQSLFSSRKTRVLGLDISSSAVKLLELTRSGDCCCVQNFGKEILPEQVMSGHVVQDIPALAQAIQSLLFKLDISSRTDVALQAVIAVPDACTITRTIQVSERLADQDLEELALSELTQCMPDALEEL